MGPRNPQAGPSILSKSTPKTIVKQPHSTAAAAEQKQQILALRLAPKLAALRKETQERIAAEPASDKSPSGPTKSESISGRIVTNGQSQAVPKTKQDQPSAAFEIANKVLHSDSPQQTQNTDYQKLVRPIASRTREAVFHPPRAPSPTNSSSSYSDLQESTVQYLTDGVHSYKEYEVGVVFSFATHEHHYDQSQLDIQDDSTMTWVGVVNSKYRKHVVVRRYKSHVVTLPIFTYCGNGLARKKNKNEYISIRDLDNKEHAAGAETKHGILWAEVNPTLNKEGASPWHRMSNVTSVQFTRPQIHMMNSKSTIYGKIDLDSRMKLSKLFLKAMEADNDGVETPSTPIKTHPTESVVEPTPELDFK